MGRTVISYVRSDLVHTLGEHTPIAIANPLTITDVLRRCVTDYAYRATVAQAGRAFFDRTHGPDSVVPLLEGHYRAVLNSPPHLDAPAVQDLVEYQFEHGVDARSRPDTSRPVASMNILEKFNLVRREDGLEAAARVTLYYLRRRLRS